MGDDPHDPTGSLNASTNDALKWIQFLLNEPLAEDIVFSRK